MENEEMNLQAEETIPETEPTPEADSTPETAEDAQKSEDQEQEQEREQETPVSAAEEGEEAAESEADEFRISVTHEEETRELTAQEAAVYAQKGMLYDEIAPAWSELCRMAAERKETPERLIRALAQAEDQILYDRLLQEANGNRSVADRLMELEKSKRKNAAADAEREKEAAKASARQARTERMAAEFVELQAEFPEVREFKEIPKSVVKTALDKQIHLMDAYLRYQRSENRKIENNRQSQRAAAAASVGSRADTEPEPSEMDPLIRAMLDGVNAAL